MPWFGTSFGSWFGSWFGTTGGGGGVPPLGPDGRLFAYAPSRVSVRLGWPTDVQSNADGTERRASTAAAPRITLRLSFEPQTDDEWAVLRGELFRFPADLRLIPLRFEALRVLDLEDTDLTVPAGQLAEWDWKTPGQRVLVFNDDGEGYTAVLQSAVGTGITVDASPSGGSYLDSEVFIAPLVPCYFGDGVSMSRYIENAGELQVTATVVAFNAGPPAGAALSTLNGNYLLPDSIHPGMRGSSAMNPEKIAAGIDAVDYGQIMRQRTLLSSSKVARSGMFEAYGRSEHQWWKRFLWTMRGRFETFLFPTFRPDLDLAIALDGSNIIYVVGELGTTVDYVTDWFPSPAHRYLRFEMVDGAINYRRVTNAADMGDGTQRLTLNATLVGDVARISYAEQCRLATDDIELTFEENDKMLLTLQALAVAG